MQNINKQLLEAALTGTHEGFENRIDWHTSLVLPNLVQKTHLFFIKFGGNGQTNLQDLIEFLYFKIVQFCIPPATRRAARELTAETGNESHTQAVTDTAIKLFLKATDEKIRSGEPGELILYTILEWFFKAPQLVCKMYLKTARNMPVHGADGIHILLESDGKTLNFIWGESKVYKDIGSAINSALGSIETFIASEEKPFSRDLEIIQSDAHIEDAKLKEAVLKYLGYTSAESNQKKHIFAALIAFEYESLQNCKTPADQETFFASYFADADDAAKKFDKAARDKKLEKFEFMFILVPFPSVEEFRKGFFKRLGRDVS